MISPWASLAIAGVFEIVWAVGLKYSDGFSKIWPSLFTLLAMAISLYFLAQALKTIPLGTGYAVWTGIGAAGTAILGIILFAESAQLVRMLCIALIIGGIVGLKLSAS
jgi:quaternary ammonium compound-resistance protein SugE